MTDTSKPLSLAAITPDEQAELDNLFTYHRPFGDQPARYEAIRAKAKELAVLLIGAVPRSADRTAAIRKLRECVFTANAAIAINEKNPNECNVPTGDVAPAVDPTFIPFVQKVLVLNSDAYGHLAAEEISQIVDHAEALAFDVKVELAESLRRAEFGIKTPFVSLFNAIKSRFSAAAVAPPAEAPAPAAETESVAKDALGATTPAPAAEAGA